MCYNFYRKIMVIKMKKTIYILGSILIFIVLLVLTINLYVVSSTKEMILKEQNVAHLSDIDCILILGAGVWGNKPSPMLQDRLDIGIKLYNDGIAKKIIVSGDHGSSEYDEVNIMKKYAIEKGVPSEDVFMDHAGFSTYDSVYRASEIFKAKKIIIVTQKYHLHRAIYIANKLGIKAYGVNSDPRSYAGQLFREIREVLARNKEFVKCIFKPEPTYLGEALPVSGNGNITND